MSTIPRPDLDNFSSGHMVVNKDRKIIYCNQYLKHLITLGETPLTDATISICFTNASNIFIDSYIYPLLLTEGVAKEIQVNVRDSNGNSIPVVVHIKLGDNGESFWSLYVCANRDKLQSELLEAKDKLEKQSQTLFHLATTDSLTGLLNRRELTAQAKKIISQIKRNQSACALFCIDVDFFKRVNDNHGHQAGDKVLKNLASLLLQNRRINDLVARTGGEEFVLLLPDISQKDALHLAETLRIKIEKSSTDGISITVSVGVVVIHAGTNTDFTNALHLADKALYTSKHEGRNRTTLAQMP